MTTDAKAPDDSRLKLTDLLRRVSEDESMLEIGRKAIEDTLIEWRDSRLSMLNRGNGLVIREEDGKPSDIIRFGPESALKIGLKAIAEAIDKQKTESAS